MLSASATCDVKGRSVQDGHPERKKKTSSDFPGASAAIISVFHEGDVNARAWPGGSTCHASNRQAGS